MKVSGEGWLCPPSESQSINSQGFAVRDLTNPHGSLVFHEAKPEIRDNLLNELMGEN